MNLVEKRLVTNRKCIKELDDFIETKGDIYSYVASKIFDCNIEDCYEFSFNGIKNPEGKRKRDTAKYLCLNRDFVKNIGEKFNVSDLEERIVKAFPWTDFDYIEDDEISFEDAVINSYAFITLILGYCRMNYFKNELDKSEIKEE